MVFMIIILCTLVISSASAQLPAGVEPILHQENYISPDGHQYKYGFSSPIASRNEVKGVDGVTRGYYTYKDDQGMIQFVYYTAGPDGYKVHDVSSFGDLPVQLKKLQETTPNIQNKFETLSHLQIMENQPQYVNPLVRNSVAKAPPTFGSNLNLFTGKPLTARNEQRGQFDLLNYRKQIVEQTPQVIPHPNKMQFDLLNYRRQIVEPKPAINVNNMDYLMNFPLETKPIITDKIQEIKKSEAQNKYDFSNHLLNHQPLENVEGNRVRYLTLDIQRTDIPKSFESNKPSEYLDFMNYQTRQVTNSELQKDYLERHRVAAIAAARALKSLIVN